MVVGCAGQVCLGNRRDVVVGCRGGGKFTTTARGGSCLGDGRSCWSCHWNVPLGFDVAVATICVPSPLLQLFACCPCLSLVFSPQAWCRRRLAARLGRARRS